jgi:GT2 family glycosyltransferase
MFVLPSASLISRDAFEAVGGFDERLCGYEDDDLFLRMFRAGYGNIFFGEPLSAWRIHAGSTSYTQRMSKSRQIYMKKLIDSFPDDRHRGLHYRKHCIAPRFLRCNVFAYGQAFRAGDIKQMRARVSDIESLLPDFDIKRRIIIRIAAPLMRSYWLACIASHSPQWMKIAAAKLIML